MGVSNIMWYLFFFLLILIDIIQGTCTWQFNFKFNLSEDMYAEESVDLLKNSGIHFERHEREGIETTHFAEMLIVSGKIYVYYLYRTANLIGEYFPFIF